MTPAQCRKNRVARRLVASGQIEASAHLGAAKRRVRISLFGDLSLHLVDREIELRSRKARALVAYLALAQDMRESRDRLAGLLWSETDNDKARTSLRQTLHVVRKALHEWGLTGVVVDIHYVRLDRSEFATDLDDLAASVERGEPAHRLMSEARITDSLLPGYDDIDPAFGAWLRLKRESIRQRLMQELEDQLSEGRTSARCRKRTACALLQLDPTNEVACRGLMRAFMEAENVAGALAAYGQLWSCLEKDYDIEPSAATQELAVTIKNGTYATH
jgi:DNA-binding SARP family transcriptional activator